MVDALLVDAVNPGVRVTEAVEVVIIDGTFAVMVGAAALVPEVTMGAVTLGAVM